MLKIRKDGVERIVTSGVYENLFKGLGYEIVNEKSVEKVIEPEEVEIKTDNIEIHTNTELPKPTYSNKMNKKGNR